MRCHRGCMPGSRPCRHCRSWKGYTRCEGTQCRHSCHTPGRPGCTPGSKLCIRCMSVTGGTRCQMGWGLETCRQLGLELQQVAAPDRNWRNCTTASTGLVQSWAATGHSAIHCKGSHQTNCRGCRGGCRGSTAATCSTNGPQDQADQCIPPLTMARRRHHHQEAPVSALAAGAACLVQVGGPCCTARPRS